MPTEDFALASVMRALLSVGAVTMEEIELPATAIVQKRAGWRLTVHSTVILDRLYSEAVESFLTQDRSEKEVDAIATRIG